MTIQPPPQNLPPKNQRRYSEPVPFVEWDEVYTLLQTDRGFLQGDHVAIIGPTGGGKTHIALHLAELRDYILFLACKPQDPLIRELGQKGYFITSKLEVPYVEDPPGSKKMRPMHRRVVFWPRLHPDRARKLPPERLLDAEKAVQKPAMKGAIGYVRRNGGWCVIIDEATWVCRDLNLQRDVDSALFQFRTLGASVILCGQRPAWMGRYALSQPTHLFLFQTSNKDDIKALGDISGVNHERVISTIGSLDHDSHEVLYVNTRTRELMRTIAPPM